MDTRSQTSPDTHWHIFRLVYDVPYKEVIIPNARAFYDSIKDPEKTGEIGYKTILIILLTKHPVVYSSIPLR